jgi:hypothetical protein
MPIRAIPKLGGPDMYLDQSKFTREQREALMTELDKRGFWVQYLHLDDPTYLLVEAEVRQRLEAEQEASK